MASYSERRLLNRKKWLQKWGKPWKDDKGESQTMTVEHQLPVVPSKSVPAESGWKQIWVPLPDDLKRIVLSHLDLESLFSFQDAISGNALSLLSDAIDSSVKDLHGLFHLWKKAPETSWRYREVTTPLGFIRCHTIDLRGLDLEVLPEALGSLPLLTELNLDRNSLTILPKSLENCAMLEHLHLRGNNFAYIPSSIPDDVRVLGLDENPIREIPLGTLSRFRRLETLDILYCGLAVLPDDLCPMFGPGKGNLHILRASGNEFTDEYREMVREQCLPLLTKRVGYTVLDL